MAASRASWTLLHSYPSGNGVSLSVLSISSGQRIRHLVLRWPIPPMAHSGPPAASNSHAVPSPCLCPPCLRSNAQIVVEALLLRPSGRRHLADLVALEEKVTAAMAVDIKVCMWSSYCPCFISMHLNAVVTSQAACRPSACALSRLTPCINAFPRRPPHGRQVLSNDVTEMDDKGLARVARFLDTLQVRRELPGLPPDGGSRGDLAGRCNIWPRARSLSI